MKERDLYGRIKEAPPMFVICSVCEYEGTAEDFKLKTGNFDGVSALLLTCPECDNEYKVSNE